MNNVIYYATLWFPKKPGEDFGVTFVDFPGCVSAGKTDIEALENAREALIFHVEGMLEDGDDLPQPSAFFDVKMRMEKGIKTLDEKDQSFVHAAISIPKPQKSVRFNVLASSADLVRIDRAAEKLGMPRSRFLVESALEKADHVT